MKYLWAILSLFILSNAYAVNSAHCPRTLNFQGAVTRLYNLDQNNLPSQYRSEHLPKMKKIQEELSWEPTMDMNFTISFAASGACYYEGRDFTGIGYQAKIEDTKKGISLFIFNDDRGLRIPLSKLSPASVTAKTEKMEVVYRLKVCSPTRCKSMAYPLASGDIDSLN